MLLVTRQAMSMIPYRARAQAAAADALITPTARTQHRLLRRCLQIGHQWVVD
jgi:hypothetical protein